MRTKLACFVFTALCHIYEMCGINSTLSKNTIYERAQSPNKQLGQCEVLKKLPGAK